MKNKHHSPAEHFTTKPSEGGCAITGYTDPGGDVVIPGVIGGLKVVGIGQRVFESCSALTSIIIPDSVTQISKEAFEDCNELTLRVRGGSCAHQYAIDQAIPFELI